MNTTTTASIATLMLVTALAGPALAQVSNGPTMSGASLLLSTQASPGQPIIGTFLVSPGWGSRMVRVHIGLAYSDSWCFMDLPVGPGTKSFSFDGDWHSQNGHKCSSILPIPAGAKVRLNVKVEVRDPFARLATLEDGLAPNTWFDFIR